MKCSAPYNSVDLDGIEDRVQTGALHKLDFAGLRVRVKNNGKPQCSIEDTNGDGFDDLVCRFEDNAANWHPNEGYAVLTGSLKNGDPSKGPILSALKLLLPRQV